MTKNKKWYEWLLVIVFVAMVLLCVVLNFTSGQKEDIANIIVNGVMFIIVAVIFINCDINCFSPMNDICADLEQISAKIRKDAMNSHQFLWEPYEKGNVELFTNERLKDAFEDYRFELNRIEDAQNAYYKCSIDDYINTDMVDTVMHRNQLNQVAGALTGLGILGTFIGLSIGLQQFNTGSTAEITNSIEPLMNGIKVAFHTSIYGMVFSLVFNYVYKRKLYESELSIEEFVTNWKKFVIPDTQNDGTNHMVALQEETLKAVRGLSDRMSEEMAAQLKPNFDRLEKVITDFARVATADQRTALKNVVDEFVAEMDRSLNSGFTKLGATIDEQARLTHHNIQMVEDFYSKVVKTEEEMQKNILSLNMQNETNSRLISKVKEDFKEVIDACDDATDAADELRGVLEKKGRR